MNREAFASLVKAESAVAAVALEQAKQALERQDAEALEQHLKEFILRKFLLAEAGTKEDNLIGLARESTERILKLTGGDLKAADISIGCTGASTPATKKILLLLTLREYFDASFDPARSADIETVKDLCGVLMEGRKEPLVN